MKTKDIIADLAGQSDVPDFTRTRDAGLTRLSQFADSTGDVYDRCRNYDLGPGQRANVSAFSPWIRHRLMTETEVLGAVLKAHDFQKLSDLSMKSFGAPISKAGLNSIQRSGLLIRLDYFVRLKASIKTTA